MKSSKLTTRALNLLSLIVISFAFHTSPYSQERERPKIKDFGSSLRKETKSKEKNKSADDSIKIRTDLVVNEILVLDEKGFWVKGLTKEDFVISENEQQQNIEVFAQGDDAKFPRSIVLLIDHSVSEIPFIVSSIMSAKVLVDNLNPNDRMAIVTDDVELLCDFTKDKKLLKEKLESLKTRMIMRNFGDSRQYSALQAVFNELFSKEDIRQIVIFQTDGDQINLKNKKIDSEELKYAVEKSHATIYSIFPGLSYEGLSEKAKYLQAETELKSIAERFRDKTNFDLNSKAPLPKHETIISHYEKTAEQQEFLRLISNLSGGWLEYLQAPAQAEQIYQKILESINKRYIIGYYPKNASGNSKRRSVKIEVKNHPEYKIEGRKTYFPQE